MTTIAIDRFGRVVIPKDVRERHGWGPGTTLELNDDSASVRLEAVAVVNPEAGGLRLAEGHLVYGGSWAIPVGDEDPTRSILQAVRDERIGHLASLKP